MKKYIELILVALITLLILSTIINLPPSEVHAKSLEYYGEPQKIRCTCYIEHGITASGQKTRPHTAAGPREWLGCVGALYQVKEDGTMGDFIGYYEFTDTGAGIDTDGDGKGDTIINGESIDVWEPDIEMAQEWIDINGDYVYMKLIRGKG
jgi:hypothetical protein